MISQSRHIFTVPPPSLPLKSRLAPHTFQLHVRRANVTPVLQRASASTSTTTTSHNDSSSPSPQASQPTSLTPSQKQYLNSALRVNQAGELAAILIYAAQTPPILRQHPHLRPLMRHMYDQEAGHFATFSALLARHRIRPTAMYPVWHALATGLGWATGVMGREAAMACTEAVETEIGEHYNEQVRTLLRWKEEGGGELGKELEGLLETVRRVRDEELEHLDHAVQEDAKLARPYEVLNAVIRAGCRGAIWISEKV